LIASKDMKKDDAIFNVLREVIIEIKDFLSNDAKKQKKKSSTQKTIKIESKTVPEALSAYTNEHSIHLFEKLEIFSAAELEMRYQVDLQSYVSEIQIESRTLGDMALNHIVPTAIQYQNTLIENVQGFKEIYGATFKKHSKEQLLLLEQISDHIAAISQGVLEMVNARKKANAKEDPKEKALSYAKEVLPYLTSIRFHCDALELRVDDAIWPLAKYRELLFIR